MNILIVEDDLSLAKALQMQLMSLSEVDITNCSRDAINKAFIKPYDVFLLDLHLPDGDGINLCKKIRTDNLYAPILMISGCSEVASKVTALEAGANDYMIKPIDVRELRARINAATRYISNMPYKYSKEEDLVIDPQSRTVIRSGQQIRLRKKEFDILCYMVRHSGKVINRNTLIDHIWGANTDPSSNMVDVHFNYLRNQLDKPFKTKLLHTVHGIGYVFRANTYDLKGGEENQ